MKREKNYECIPIMFKLPEDQLSNDLLNIKDSDNNITSIKNKYSIEGRDNIFSNINSINIDYKLKFDFDYNEDVEDTIKRSIDSLVSSHEKKNTKLIQHKMFKNIITINNQKQLNTIYSDTYITKEQEESDILTAKLKTYVDVFFDKSIHNIFTYFNINKKFDKFDFKYTFMIYGTDIILNSSKIEDSRGIQHEYIKKQTVFDNLFCKDNNIQNDNIPDNKRVDVASFINGISLSDLFTVIQTMIKNSGQSA